MIISIKHRFAFVSTVKGGTNSLYRVLNEHFEGARYGTFHHNDVSDIPPNWFLFTTCRNPYTRAVSVWYSSCMRGEDRYGLRQLCPNPDSFEAFAEWAALMQSQLGRLTLAQQELLRTQTQHHAGIPFQRILRVEQLEQEFNTLPFVGANYIQIPELNSTQSLRSNTDEHLTDRAILAVRRWMQPDFDNYGYSLEYAPGKKIQTVA